ncbi:hypothetical protein AB1Y20_014715 [Prymnesium parvum]|uniref:dolichyl-diphosphooligosaccharide--protein glycotransferase n=1 Tax=Prymnesium parvum TaxID=97485 RepID=A0AB34IEF0_PRYPA
MRAALLAFHRLIALSAAAVVLLALRWAHDFRMHAIHNFGPVIHEFDPWFNYRATEYLVDHGLHAFLHWFDHSSWYPLGRPVSTTLYPAMQLSAAAIHAALRHAGAEWPLEHVCAYVPVWFGMSATLFTALLAYEASAHSAAAAAAAAAVMAILPAHLARSVGGGFDNESVALTALCATFYFWTRALRSRAAWPAALAAAGSYAFMAAAWGGYVFVVNAVAAHALLLLVCYGHSPRHLTRLCRAYSLFYCVGTALAMSVPVVGTTPLSSLEHLLPLAAFLTLLSATLLSAARPSSFLGPQHLRSLAAAGAAAALLLAAALSSPHFRPLSARVHALFLPHTRTGNPLVDSVAEHAPTSPSSYWRYLDATCYAAPLGAALLLLRALTSPSRAMGPSFLLVLAAATYFFSRKMSRLVVLLGCPAAALSGVAIGAAVDCALSPLARLLGGPSEREAREGRRWYDAPLACLLRLAVAAELARRSVPLAADFYGACDNMARYALSHPQIVYKDASGKIVDDYREAYAWLRQHTPADARVMAWWDYGYQITGIANRTTLADGNTWNHEHIALLGLALTSPLAESHAIARHLADYVLVWKGGGSDDRGKSAHMARIATSVHTGHCAEADCNGFGFYQDGRPTRMMAESLIYHLTAELFDSVAMRPYAREAYVSSRGLVRIVRLQAVDLSSRQWAADPRHRRCDAPGSWYCPGRYPPKLRALFAAAGGLHGDGGGDDAAAAADSAEAEAYRSLYEARLRAQEATRPRPNGAGLPRGSFLESCRGCSLDGALLRCTHCSAAGPALDSTLDLRSCRRGAGGGEGGVDNIQGRLECTPQPNAPGIPAGGYQQSCQVVPSLPFPPSSAAAPMPTLPLASSPLRAASPRSSLVLLSPVSAARLSPPVPQGCRLEQSGAVLWCSHCSTASGARREAEYELRRCAAPAALDNHDGKLFCSGVRSAADIPEGAFRHSCQGCSQQSGVLSCSHCSTADGRQLAAELTIAGCKQPAEIDNRDGVLVCS